MESVAGLFYWTAFDCVYLSVHSFPFQRYEYTKNLRHKYISPQTTSLRANSILPQTEIMFMEIHLNIYQHVICV